MLSKGARLTLSCSDLDDEGAAVAEVSGGDGELGRVHVAGALPGERVIAVVEHLSPHRPDAWARLEAIEVAADWRVTPACAAYGQCGGCVMQHLDYAPQVAWKGSRVEALLAKAPRLATVPVDACVASPRPLGYRNKSKLVFGRGPDGAAVLGAFAPRSHRLVDLAGCRIAQPPLDDVAATLRGILEAAGVEPYDERRLTGVLRHVILRASHTGEVLATLVTRRGEWPAGPEVARALRGARPEVAGVVQNVNPASGNVLYGHEETVLASEATLEDAIGEVRLRVSSRSFLQANRDVAAIAYAQIAASVQGLGVVGRVVDVYAGVGAIALTMAPLVREVIGIEEHPAAVEDATASAALNGIENARFVAGDAAASLADVEVADVVVLNPPRKGCEPAVLDAAAQLAPRLIAYLSCAPDTLVRDLEHLATRGYATRSVTPYDMLPHTTHVEALAIVDRLEP